MNHILNDSSCCIDLAFNSQPYLLTDSGVHPFLHRSCHHQINFAKFNLHIFYLPPYERKIRHYQKTNFDLIKSALNLFRWKKTFWNIDVDEMVSIFYETIISILYNFISHDNVLFDNRDSPWINKKIRKLIHEKKTNSDCFGRSNNNK